MSFNFVFGARTR